MTDSDGIDHFRIVEGDRLMWASPETTWAARPQRFAGAIARRIRTIFPQLGKVEIAEVWGGAIGQTVHGMPQIGQLRRGLWVASGFGRQGLNTSAIAGQLIARSILWGDERWRLFSPFELVWAGGPTGRVAGHARRHVGTKKCRPPPGRWPAIGNGRAPRNAGARRVWPRPTARPEPGRRAEPGPGSQPPAGRPRARTCVPRRSQRSLARVKPARLFAKPDRGMVSSLRASRKKVRKFGANRCNFGLTFTVS